MANAGHPSNPPAKGENPLRRTARPFSAEGLQYQAITP
jgi:hypothetical protein